MTFPRIGAGPETADGYRTLVRGAVEGHRDRSDLAARPAGLGEPLLTVAHLSDLHLCDAQSPARVEFLDRWADPDSPVADVIGEVGTYRAQEILTAQVADAMVRAVNGVEHGPVGGAPVDLAIVTGDNTDNAQANELAWYLAVLTGGLVAPDSGDRTRFEGVADETLFDERYWHPEAATGDLPHVRYGFPRVPGLLDAVRRPFTADGLRVPWLAVHGNHDRLLQGTVPGSRRTAEVAIGAEKPVGLLGDWPDDAIVGLLAGLAACDPAALAVLAQARTRPVTADPARRTVTRAEFVNAHFGPGHRPEGHGFTPDNRTSGRTYYRHDVDGISFVVLDTVNEYGGWQGALDPTQLAWLDDTLHDLDRARRYAIIASHHPLHTLVNDTAPPGVAPRRLAADVDAVLSRHPSVVLWLNGHTHATAVQAHGSYWEVTAPSAIDWPQQGRIVEVLRGGGVLTFATTMLDHAGPAPWSGAIDDPVALAALARELAANDWQWRAKPLDEHPRAGDARDRSALLHLVDPWR